MSKPLKTQVARPPHKIKKKPTVDDSQVVVVVPSQANVHPLLPPWVTSSLQRAAATTATDKTETVAGHELIFLVVLVVVVDGDV